MAVKINDVARPRRNATDITITLTPGEAMLLRNGMPTVKDLNPETGDRDILLACCVMLDMTPKQVLAQITSLAEKLEGRES